MPDISANPSRARSKYDGTQPTMFGDDSENDDGSTADDQNNEPNGPYGFVRDASKEEDGNEDEGETETDGGSPPTGYERWSLGDHSTAGEETVANIQHELDALDDDVDADVKAVLQEAASMLGTSSVSGFECPVCGLNHKHSDTKHDIRRSPETRPGVAPGFNITERFAEQMQFNPWCHCGANEAAMLADFFGFFDIPMFKDQENFEGVLELPNHVVQDIFQQYRELESNARRTVTIQNAISEAGYAYTVPEELDHELELFYERWSDMKDAANGAPISGEARNNIEEKRASLEAYVA